MSTFKYIPSQDLLMRVYNTLLAAKKSLHEDRFVLEQQRPTVGFGFHDEQEYQREINKWNEKDAAVYAQLQYVNMLLRPFEDDARKQWEEFERARCEQIMAL